MAPQGYFSCICCGNLYKSDGSENELFEQDHDLLWFWICEQVHTHVPTEDNYGYTCDERGCAFCNADSNQQAASYWYNEIKHPASPEEYSYYHNRPYEPDSQEMEEAFDWWLNGGRQEWEENGGKAEPDRN